MHGTVISKVRVTLSDGSHVFDVVMSRPGAEMVRFNCPDEPNADSFVTGLYTLLNYHTLDCAYCGLDREENCS
jgi:hypothetical protein